MIWLQLLVFAVLGQQSFASTNITSNTTVTSTSASPDYLSENTFIDDSLRKSPKLRTVIMKSKVAPAQNLGKHSTQITRTRASSTLSSPLAVPTKHITLSLTHKLMNLDGVSKLMMVANDQLDYPIEVNKGDFVEVTVVNKLNVSTSIHWHGIFQEDTPWMDGPGMVTQCLIHSGKTLVYKFSTGNQTGTFWWHAHYASQYVDGLRGPFIIHDPHDPNLSQYDEELTISLSDHFHQSALTVLRNYRYAYDPAPDSGIINGVGRCNCSSITALSPGTKCALNPHKTFVVKKGKRYRLRIINMSAAASFNFSIDGHSMSVVEQDGVYTNPTVIDSFSIAASQRYSVIISANAAVNNYWMRAIMMDMYTPTGSTIQNGLDFTTRAIWRYVGAKVRSPITKSKLSKPLNVYNLGELNGLTSATLPTWTSAIYFAFTITYDTKTNASVSQVTLVSDNTNFFGSSYQMPSKPTLQDMLDGNQLPKTSNVIPVTNGWMFMQIRNTDNVEHVFHLHGHTFYVIGVGKMLHSEVTTATYPRRDAIQVPLCAGGQGGTGETGCVPGFVNILIPFTHPGAWLFHCHVEWHMRIGLVVTFVNYDGLEKVAKNIPDDWWDSCSA